jgi:MFS family permease
MTAIARGSVTEPHELGRFIDDEKRVAGRSSPAPGRGLYRPRLRRRTAFWLLAAVLCLLFVATAAPAPLYGVYQAEWHFSVTTLTAVFAVYAFVLLVTLLMFGSVSDYFGRRRTIVAGLAAYGMACAVFLAAGDVSALVVARALQGVAVGLATGALGAAMLELQPERSRLAPPVTSAAGPLGLAIGGSGQAHWSSTGQPAPISSGGCCWARVSLWSLLCWRCRSQEQRAPARARRFARVGASLVRREACSPWPCRA